MLHDYLNVLVLFMVVGLGAWLAHRKWLTEASNTLFTRLLINIALPATLVLSINRDFTRQEFLKLLPGIILPAGVILSLMLGASLIAKVLRIEQSDRGLFIGLCAMSSTIFFGIPVTLAVYGYHGLPYALMTYATQTVIYWTLGLYLLDKEAFGEHAGQQVFRHIINEIINMPLIAFFLGVAILLSGLAIPFFMNEFLSYLSGMTSALAMLVVGTIMCLSGFRKITVTVPLLAVACFRFILAPAAVILWGGVFAVDREMIKITVLICSLPIPNTTVILAEKYRVNVRFATESLSFTIGIYLFFLPVILMVIHHL